MKWLDGITNSMDMSLSKFMCPWGGKELDMTERLTHTTHGTWLDKKLNSKLIGQVAIQNAVQF